MRLGGGALIGAQGNYMFSDSLVGIFNGRGGDHGSLLPTCKVV